MKDPKNEFHLEKTAWGWTLSQYAFSPAHTYEKFIRQPGEPTYSKFSIGQPTGKQPVKFRLRAIGEQGAVRSIKMLIDNSIEILIPADLSAGETLIVDGSRSIIILDKTGKRKSSHVFSKDMPVLDKGIHSVTLDAKFEGTQAPVLETQFRFDGVKEEVKKK